MNFFYILSCAQWCARSEFFVSAGLSTGRCFDLVVGLRFLFVASIRLLVHFPAVIFLALVGGPPRFWVLALVIFVFRLCCHQVFVRRLFFRFGLHRSYLLNLILPPPIPSLLERTARSHFLSHGFDFSAWTAGARSAPVGRRSA
jgi:hypothetical protein